jgi:hypothetical protein
MKPKPSVKAVFVCGHALTMVAIYKGVGVVVVVVAVVECVNVVAERRRRRRLSICMVTQVVSIDGGRDLESCADWSMSQPTT